jgi:hypothetical protein
VIHVDFELHRFLHYGYHFRAETAVPLHDFVFTAAEKAASVRNHEPGGELSAGFAFPGVFDIRTANAVRFDCLMTFGTG